jgi:hypothetical protein
VCRRLRPGHDILTTADGFRWFDAATRFTWKALVDMDASQVEGINASVLEADNRLVFKALMGALMNPTPRLKPRGWRSWGSTTLTALCRSSTTAPRSAHPHAPDRAALAAREAARRAGGPVPAIAGRYHGYER